MTAPPAAPQLALIVAMDRARAIGRDGGMPWHLPDDLRHFKQVTMGKPVLMGRRTWDSIGRALPGRRNLVLTRQDHAHFGGAETVTSLDQARALCADAPELMVIGGGAVYAMTLPLAHTLWLTEIDTEVADADTWFPPHDPAQWQEIWHEHRAADERHAHARTFRQLQRRTG